MPDTSTASLNDIGEQLGLSARTMRHYASLDGFPAPHETRGRTRMYDVRAVRDWYARYERRGADDSQAPVADAMTLQEVAEFLGISYGSMRTYLGRYNTFPKPIARRGHRPLFDPNAVAAWRKRQQKPHPVQANPDIQVTEVDGLLPRDSVAKLLDVKPATVTTYALRSTEFSKDFPQPARTIGRTRLWDRQDILDWVTHRTAQK